MNGLPGVLDGARVLHLFANYKWTGPADPAIRTAARLRALGVDVAFAQAGFVHRGGEHRVAEELWRWRLPVVTGLELRKHFHIASLRRDVQALRALLLRDRYGVLHCHQTADHLIAALACRRVAKPPLIVRSLYDPEPPPRGLRTRFCFLRTHGVVAPTRRAAAGVVERFGLAADAVLFQEPVVEPRAQQGADLRAAWGLAPAHRVVGITARIQPHRRFELLWQVARAVVDELPAARFVLLGRGNEQDMQALVTGPVRALRLQDHVVLPGYLREPDYSAALRSLDLFLFLVPGSDGTCRAVREAMAQGLPVVATRRGILPELLAPVRAGEVPGEAVAEDGALLARALLAYLRDEPRRRAAGDAARRRAELDMDPQAAARALAAFYTRLLGAACGTRRR
jgi:glycosyltransferase involved in cell wall biosynthesis